MTVEPFRNEPIETFQTEEARRAMREALRRVREEFGRHYPLYIGGEWVDTKERMVSLMAREHKSDEVVALNPRGHD